MRGILPIAIRASRILGVDSDLRAGWKDLLENLVPLKDWRHCPVTAFDHYTLESKDARRHEFARRVVYPKGFPDDEKLAPLSWAAVVSAICGREDIIEKAIPNQLRGERLKRFSPRFDEINGVGVLRNRMDLREGVNCVNAQRLGIAAHSLQLALCQSVPPGPAGDPVIRLFEAWPRQWDATFRLLCRGGFLVSSAMRDGGVGFVEVESQAGGTCRLRNPWPGRKPALYRDGGKVGVLEGGLLEIETRCGQVFRLVPE